MISRLIAEPVSEHYQVLGLLVFAMALLFLTFSTLLLGSATLSLLTGRRGAGSATRHLLAVVGGSATNYLTLGILPFLSLVVLVGQSTYGFGLDLPSRLLKVLAVLVIAFFVLYLYQRRGGTALGVTGATLLAAALFFFTSVMNLLLDPERWESAGAGLPGLHSGSVAVHFLMLVAMAVLLTGAAVLFFLFRWPESRLPEDAAGKPALLRLGGGLTLAAAVMLPLLLSTDSRMLPEAISQGVGRRPMVGGLAVLVTIALLAFSMLRRRHARFATALGVLALLFVCCGIARQHSLYAAGAADSRLALETAIGDKHEAIMVEREELYARLSPVNVEIGQEIYERKCSNCHEWEEESFGPAYSSVLPKYRSDEEALKTYLRKPSKIDPDFPAMPNPKLGESQIESVVLYLLSQ